MAISSEQRTAIKQRSITDSAFRDSVLKQFADAGLDPKPIVDKLTASTDKMFSSRQYTRPMQSPPEQSFGGTLLNALRGNLSENVYEKNVLPNYAQNALIGAQGIAQGATGVPFQSEKFTQEHPVGEGVLESLGFMGSASGIGGALKTARLGRVLGTAAEFGAANLSQEGTNQALGNRKHSLSALLGETAKGVGQGLALGGAGKLAERLPINNPLAKLAASTGIEASAFAGTGAAIRGLEGQNVVPTGQEFGFEIGLPIAMSLMKLPSVAKYMKTQAANGRKATTPQEVQQQIQEAQSQPEIKAEIDALLQQHNQIIDPATATTMQRPEVKEEIANLEKELQGNYENLANLITGNHGFGSKFSKHANKKVSNAIGETRKNIQDLNDKIKSLTSPEVKEVSSTESEVIQSVRPEIKFDFVRNENGEKAQFNTQAEAKAELIARKVPDSEIVSTGGKFFIRYKPQEIKNEQAPIQAEAKAETNADAQTKTDEGLLDEDLQSDDLSQLKFKSPKDFSEGKPFQISNGIWIRKEAPPESPNDTQKYSSYDPTGKNDKLHFATLDAEQMRKASNGKIDPDKLFPPEPPLEEGGVPVEPKPVKPKITPSKNAVKKLTPFEYQDSVPEKLIHTEWKEGNLLKYAIENAGDILREHTKEFPAESYYSEKIGKIERFLNDRFSANEAIMRARQHHGDQLQKIIEAYEEQPTENKIQELSKNLSISLAEGNINKAKYFIQEIKKETKNAIKAQETQKAKKETTARSSSEKPTQAKTEKIANGVTEISPSSLTQDPRLQPRDNTAGKERIREKGWVKDLADPILYTDEIKGIDKLVVAGNTRKEMAEELKIPSVLARKISLKDFAKDYGLAEPKTQEELFKTAEVFAKLHNQIANEQSFSENIKSYKELKQGGASEKLLDEMFSKRTKNAIDALTSLDPNGSFIKVVENGIPNEGQGNLATYARYVGQIRKLYPDKFTDRTEQEVYDYLTRSSKVPSIKKDTFVKAIEDRITDLEWNPETGKLNLEKRELVTGAKAHALSKEELQEERSDIKQKLNEAVTPSEVQHYQTKLDELDKKIEVANSNQPDLFASQEDAARKRIDERNKGVGANIPLQNLVDWGIIGSIKVARGTVKFAEWSAEMVKEFGEKIRPHLHALYKQATTGFYLKSRGVVVSKFPEKVTSEVAEKTLLNSGISPDEIKWVLSDLFAQAKKENRMLSQKEILDTIDNNHAVEVENVVYGGSKASDESTIIDKQITENHDEYLTLKEELDNAIDKIDRNLTSRVDVENGLAEGGKASYVLEEFYGDSYYVPKELLESIDKIGTGLFRNQERYKELLRSKDHYGSVVVKTKYSGYKSIQGGENYGELVITLPNARGNYESTHWQGVKNPVFHVRFDDRNIGGKKTLFVHEMQSDMARDSRAMRDNKDVSVVSWGEQWAVHDKRNNAYIEDVDGDLALFHTKEEAESVRDNFLNVSDAPFVRKWQELATKKVVQYAVENGYDKVAWATGEQVAGMFDLRKHIDRLDWQDRGGRNGIQVWGFKRDQLKLEKNGIPHQELDKHIPKNVAEDIRGKIEEGRSSGKITGDNLAIGGEWADNLYDKQFPQLFSDLGKRYGAVAKREEINAKPRIIQLEADDFVIKNGDGNTGLSHYESREEAQDFINKHMDNAPPSVVNSFDIPDNLRKVIKEQGQSLFGANRTLGNQGGFVRIPTKEDAKRIGKPFIQAGKFAKELGQELVDKWGDVYPQFQRTAFGRETAERITSVETNWKMNQGKGWDTVKQVAMKRAPRNWSLSQGHFKDFPDSEGVSNYRYVVENRDKPEVINAIPKEIRNDVLKYIDEGWRIAADEIATDAEAIGLQVWDKDKEGNIELRDFKRMQNYLPRMFTKEFVKQANKGEGELYQAWKDWQEAQHLKNYVSKIETQIKRIDQQVANPPAGFSEDTAWATEQSKWRAELKKEIDNLDKYEPFSADGLEFGGEGNTEPNVRSFGSLENPRYSNAPDYIQGKDGKWHKIHETDPHDISNRYIGRSTRRLAFVKEFGQFDEDVTHIGNELAKEGKQGKALSKHWTEFVSKLMQGLPIEEETAFHRAVRFFNNPIRVLQLSGSALAQVGGLNYVPSNFGVRASFRGATDLFKNEVRKGTLQDMRMLQGVNRDFMSMNSTVTDIQGFNRQLGEIVATGTGNKALNHLIDDYSMLSAKHSVEGLVKTIGDIRDGSKVAKGYLNKMWGLNERAAISELKNKFHFSDVDISQMISDVKKNGKLSEYHLAQVAQKAPAIANAISEGVLSRQGWMHKTLWQNALNYTNFTRAVGRAFTHASRELKYGNIKPMLYLLVGTAAAGEVQVSLKNLVYDRDRKDEGIGQRLLTDWTQGALFGLPSVAIEGLNYAFMGHDLPSQKIRKYIGGAALGPTSAVLFNLGDAAYMALNGVSRDKVYNTAVLKNVPLARAIDTNIVKGRLTDPYTYDRKKKYEDYYSKRQR